MSYTDLATLAAYEATVAKVVKLAGDARRELLLELYEQDWDVAKAGSLTHKPTRTYVPTMKLLALLTDDSADPNYIRLVVHLMKCGWQVLPDGKVLHRDGHGPMPVNEALLATITVASEA